MLHLRPAPPAQLRLGIPLPHPRRDIVAEHLLQQRPERPLTVVAVRQNHHADQLRLPFALWTRPAIAQLIERRFGIALPVRTMGHYLKRWGFTAQKPLKRAYEQRPEAVAAWLKTMYPAITLEPEGTGTRYTAHVMHGDPVSRQKHAEMGFEGGWGAAFGQLVELMKAQ